MASDLGIRWSRAGGTRTPDHRFWRPALYQLSYRPKGACVLQILQQTPTLLPPSDRLSVSSWAPLSYAAHAGSHFPAVQDQKRKGRLGSSSQRLLRRRSPVLCACTTKPPRPRPSLPERPNPMLGIPGDYEPRGS